MSELKLVEQYTYKDILKAYLDCRKRKRTKDSSIEYELNYEENLKSLLKRINTETYNIGRTRCFAITRPKPREIWAAQFEDRIVQHLVYNSVGEWFEDRFIEDTYSCIKERGTLAANKRLQKVLRKSTQNWSKQSWALQLDIANFFVSISRPILWNLVENKIGNLSLTSKLLKQIIFEDPIETAVIINKESLNNIPKRKSLFYCPKDHGLCVGNLTSQFLSNVYLNELDKYAKHVLKIKYYVRYVDDIVIIDEDREKLYELKEKLNSWLITNRESYFQPNKTKIKPANSGINFVGIVIHPYRNYIRNMTKNNFYETINKFKALDHISKIEINKIKGYSGIFKHTNSFNITKDINDTIKILEKSNELL